jgi:hypothetical protein
VSYGDDVIGETNYSSHATHVAGTIAAAGRSPDGASQGVAYSANIKSYDYDGTETIPFLKEVENEMIEQSIFLANHSHSTSSGWHVKDITEKWQNRILNGLEGAKNSLGKIYTWYGSRVYEEDAAFGQYNYRATRLDELLYENPNFLSVWSASNNRDERGFFNTEEDMKNETHYAAYFHENPGLSGWAEEGWYYVPDKLFLHQAPTAAMTITLGTIPCQREGRQRRIHQGKRKNQ